MITELKTTLGTWIAVRVPDDAYDFEIDNHQQFFQLLFRASFNGLENVGHLRPLPAGEWEIVGRAWELSEEQWKGIAPDSGGKIFDYDPKHYPSYPNYLNVDHPFESGFVNTATESGHSLLNANGIYQSNPLTHPCNKQVGRTHHSIS